MKDTARLQRNELQNPSAIYRSAPFWSWNGEMEEQRVSQQLSAFYEVGMGGGFIHSRSGLKTPYMEEQWFACVQAAIDTAVRENGKVYLYDEDRYSSGFAGGDVCRQNPDFRQRHDFARIAIRSPANDLQFFAAIGNFANRKMIAAGMRLAGKDLRRDHPLRDRGIFFDFLDLDSRHRQLVTEKSVIAVKFHIITEPFS